jgi:Pentapeptide repeats (9 copies)
MQTIKKSSKNNLICVQEKWSHSTCKGLKVFKEYEGNNYCVLHYPQPDKVVAFHDALSKKLDAKDFNFSFVWFPNTTNFEAFHFVSNVSFHHATFNSNTYFGQVKFDGEADFSHAKFDRNVYFHRSAFKTGVSFYKAIFNELAYFGEINIGNEANFRSATFRNYVRFLGALEKPEFGVNIKVNFYFTHFEKPELVSFHTLFLRPRWFINVDARQFEFTNITWLGKTKIREELDSLLNEGIALRYKLLAVTYRQLAINAEENHHYSKASQYRYNAFETNRIEKFKGFVPWKLDWWYWLASGYGESAKRALLIYVLLVAIFACTYMYVDFGAIQKTDNEASSERIQDKQPESVNNYRQQLFPGEAVIFSISTSILQKSEPKPLTIVGKCLALLETILGPAQIGLIALALRRKFMR